MKSQKKIEHTQWIELRKKEVPLTIKQAEQEENISTSLTQESTLQKIIQLIQKKDTGRGAEYEEIVKESNIANAEDLIKTLLENGDIFQVSPGKIKILE